jgi:Tol biopolymer transport system component
MQAPASGGEAQPFSGQPQNLRITDISPDRSQLVSFAFSGRSNDLPLSLTPVVGGASRRVGEVIADDAAFTRDGRRLVFNRPDGIYESDRDGGHLVRLVALQGRSENPQWSPDGRRLRFTLHEPNSDAVSIWQVSADGGNLHRVPLNLPFIASACCGRWSLDGRYFFFTVEREGLQSIWAIRDRDAGWFRRPAKPVQLTFGPNNYGGLINDPNPGDFNPGDSNPSDGNSAGVSPGGADPVASSNNGVRRERALVWSGLEEMETSRYDLGTGRLQPLLAGVHSNAMSLSPDGGFLSFATGGEIWQSNADGSDRRPLASGFAPIDDVQWSPEGSQILFHAAEAGKDGHFYAISSSGGAAVELALGNGHLEPVWHPDGKQILVAKWAMDGAASLPQSGIFLFDLKSKTSTKIVGSEGLVHPSISRDGRIVAITNFDLHPNEPTLVMLHEVQSEGWREIGRGTLVNPVQWSPDGRYFYFQDILSEGERAYRYSVATGEVGLFADFAPVLNDGYVRCMLKQIAPEGQLVVSLRRNRVNLFRLDLELP